MVVFSQDPIFCAQYLDLSHWDYPGFEKPGFAACGTPKENWILLRLAPDTNSAFAEWPINKTNMALNYNTSLTVI